MCFFSSIGSSSAAADSTRSWIQRFSLGLRDVHVLDAGRPAVRVAQRVDDPSERLLAGAGQAVGEELAVEVPHGQPVVGEVELGIDAGPPSRSG